LGHGLQISGYLSLKGPLEILLKGGAAVTIFIIISGFVITHLLLRGRDTYPEYIVRRFFRLYPAYFMCGLAGFLISGMWPSVVHSVPWETAEGWSAYAKTIDEISFETRHNALPHIALHAVMLHGLVPNEVLNHAAWTLLSPAWSLSLEWQFYLIAPLILVCLRKTVSGLLVIAAAGLFLMLYRQGTLGTFDLGSSLAAASGYFAVGIASRLAVEPLSKRAPSPLLISFAAWFALLAFVPDWLPLAVWFPLFAYLLWSKHAPYTKPIFDWITASRVPLFLGRISYSLYLVHRPVQIVLGTVYVSFFPVAQGAMLIVQLGAVILAVAAAYALHLYVEAPGIAIGRRAASFVRAHSSAILQSG
jgi:peptidoglycan/LPS O-acetylase OafA/YrhL